jgi:hypothetical protein
MKRLQLILIIFLAALSACTENVVNDVPPIDSDKPSRPEDYGEFVLQEDVKFIAEAYEDFIVEVIDSTAIVLSNDMPADLKPKVGDVIYCMVTPNSPNGFAGKVVAAQNDGKKTRFSTEGVLLTDIFEDLRLEMQIDFPEDVTYMVDEDGKRVDCRSVSNEIWKEMEETAVTVDTKAEYNASVSHTFELGVHDHEMYEGNIYVGLGTSVSVEITKGKLEKLSFTNTKRCGLIGTMKCSWDNTDDNQHKEKLFDKTIVLPFSIVAGPLILTPDLYIEAGFFYEGEIGLEGSLSFELENTRCRFGYENGKPVYETENIATAGNRVFALDKFEAKGETGIYAETAVEMALYTRKMLALGASAEASFGLAVSGEVSFGNEDLLQINPMITVGPELNTGVYCFSELLKKEGNDTKFGFFMKHELGKFEVPLFPKITNFITEAANGWFTGSMDVEKTNLIKTEEEGVALFKKENSKTPLAHRQMEITAAKATTKASTKGTASFQVSNPDDYVLKPYVKADGKYWYLEDDRWVDLGLPSGILWAAYNVGASSPEEYGGYFAWGTLHKWGDLPEDQMLDEVYGKNKGNDISGTLYDAAHIIWGDNARMPTLDEIKELLDNCSFTSEYYNNVNGNFVTGPNGNKIFIPYAGHYEGEEDGYRGRGFNGLYWSSTREEEGYAYSLSIGSSVNYEWDGNWCYYDSNLYEIYCTIRPVKDK